MIGRRLLRFLLSLATPAAIACCASAPASETVASTSAALGEGIWELKSPLGLCARVSGSAVNGAPIVLGDCSPENEPVVKLERTLHLRGRDAGVELRYGYPEKCIDVGSFANGSELHLADCNGKDEQLFFVGYDATRSFATLYGVHGHCVDVRWNEGAAGTPLRIWECNQTKPQAWQLLKVASVANSIWDYGDATYAIHTGSHCLDVRNGSSAVGTPLQVYNCNRTPAQQFQIVNVNEDYAELHVLGKCVQVRGGVSASGRVLELGDCNHSGTQAFYFNRAAVWPRADRMEELKSGSFCVDRPHNATDNGTPVQLYTCNSSGAQFWEATPMDPPACTGACCDVTAPARVDVAETRAPFTALRVPCNDAPKKMYRSAGGGGWQAQGDWGWATSCKDGYLEYDDTSARPGVSYDYRVLYTAGCGTWKSAVWSAQQHADVQHDPRTPKAPTLSALAESDSSITVRVTDQSTNEEGFRVFRRGPGDSDYVLVHTEPRGYPFDTGYGWPYDYKDTTVQPHQPYSYRVVAYHSGTVESAPAFLDAFSAPAPAAVENLHVDPTLTTTESLTIKWISPDGVPQFLVEWTPGGGAPVPVYDTTYTAVGLTAGTHYKFTVHAVGLGNRMSPPQSTEGDTNSQ